MTAWPPDPRCARRCKPCECTSRRAWWWPSQSAPPAPVRNSPTSRMKPCARARAEFTKTLILRKGFNIVAVEADWPDAYRANRWVRGIASDPDAEAALGDFTRFPRWMWRNRDVVAFLEWLHDHNGSVDTAAQ